MTIAETSRTVEPKSNEVRHSPKRERRGITSSARLALIAAALLGLGSAALLFNNPSTPSHPTTPNVWCQPNRPHPTLLNGTKGTIDVCPSPSTPINSPQPTGGRR